MPSPTTVANRNVTRRRRHHRSRNNITSRRSGRSIRRPQLREQSSDDLEACFNPCQKRGLRLDPDVRIGAALGSLGNRYSVLENVESSSQSPTGTPTPLESSFSERHSIVDKSSVQTIPDEISLNLDTMPLTPPSAPRVRLPDLCPSQTDPTDFESKSPTFLRDFTIPSPLLYHKRSRDDFFGLADDNEHSNKKKFLPKAGLDATDMNLDYNSLRVGRPLKRTFRGEHPEENSNDAIVNISNDHKVTAAHDIGFYQHTRSYLSLSSESGKSSAVTPVQKPQLERPIATSTNTLRKRKANGCSRESALQTSAAPPSPARSASRLGRGMNEPSQPCSTTTAQDYQSCNYQHQVHTNSGLATPPPETYKAPSPDLPGEVTSKNHKGNADVGTAKTRIPGPVLSSDAESQTFQTPSRNRHIPNRPIETHSAHGSGSQTESAKLGDAHPFQSKSKPCTASKLKEQHTNPSSPRPTYAAVVAAPSVPSTLNTSKPTPAVPNSNHVTSQTDTQPIPDSISNDYNDMEDVDMDIPSDSDILQIRACPTPNCLGLLLSPQSSGDIGPTIEAVTHDLGFEIEHSEGCEFGTGTGIVIDADAGMGDEDDGDISEEEESGWVRLGCSGEGDGDDLDWF